MLSNSRGFFTALFLLCLTPALTNAEPFNAAWADGIERVWAGPEFWANRLQDWQVANGRLECVAGGPNRNVHVLTRELSDRTEGFTMSVRLGYLDDNLADGWVGFLVGAQTPIGDYRRRAVFGRGLRVGIASNGQLCIGDHEASGPVSRINFEDTILEVSVQPYNQDYSVAITALNPKTGEKISTFRRTGVLAERLHASLALVNHKNPATKEKANPGDVRFWFDDWTINGAKVDANPDRAFGPVLFTQYTLHRGVLKMTAQMPPIGANDAQPARLQTKSGSEWNEIAQALIDPMARTATFRIENWDASSDVPYRVAYFMRSNKGEDRDFYYEGVVRKEPLDQDTLVVAGFTGNNDFGFPNEEMIEFLRVHNPDVLAFTGDQIYEGVAGYGVQRSPLDKASIDYLRKWYLLGWSYGELMKDRPSVCLPDDHDVYHGNIWGMEGKKAVGVGKPGQDSGGYTMPAEWVRMVERTQTSHHPDAYDPAPVQQNIGVYYGEMDYGGVSFAVIEDRKFKSSPTVMLPQAQVTNGWAQNKDFDAPTQGDAPGAVLLGDRQLSFLRDWAGTWRPGVEMKCVISQTIFANVATLPASAMQDNVVPTLRILPPGEYAEGDKAVADMDSNGWPQTGRNKALRELQRGYAFHLAGDQHLGSVIQYGIDDWNDAPYAFCVPAAANVFPRRWFPPQTGGNHKPGEPNYTGDYKDGFGNRMTVHAVSNPHYTGREPKILYDRATGYGIVKFNKADRTITMECWPRYSNPADGNQGQYPGWPITVHQFDQYGRKAWGHLPTFDVKGMRDPVFRVLNESNGELVYAIRIKGASFRPKIFTEGSYTVEIGEPEMGKTQRFEHLNAIKPNQDKTIPVEF
ncbi:MAG: hypothetical protein P9L94_04635 [Candidatus Hinthialibacter antarcticus]|nr:hypothetical protein [Candidatus Hinthialibacter antarcticus]